MRLVLVLFIGFTFLNAGVFDFWNEKSAKDAYNDKKYKQSSEALKSLNKSDIRAYNLGNSYYKEGKYKQAREMYSKVKSVDRATILHNIGNSYFKENNMNEAIKAYEQAIAIRADKDTKFNLELAKKKKKDSNKPKEEKQNKPKENPKQEPKEKNKQKQQQDSLKNDTKQTKEIQQKEQSKKEMRHIMRKLEEKKMPTMMYPSQKSQRSNDDKNPW